MIDFYSGTFFVIPVKTGIQDVYGVQNPSGYLLSQETHRLSYETPPLPFVYSPKYMIPHS
jgi:hypothetical protein